MCFSFFLIWWSCLSPVSSRAVPRPGECHLFPQCLVCHSEDWIFIESLSTDRRPWRPGYWPHRPVMDDAALKRKTLWCWFLMLWSIKYSGSPEPKLTLRQCQARIWETAAYARARRPHTRYCVSMGFSLACFWGMSLQRLTEMSPLFLLPFFFSFIVYGSPAWPQTI